ncbi:MAG: MATE family efflux transporter [Bacteroidales bacterium]|nr:MATE family efflux transporter [Bacteroidales bacterium]
MDHFKTYLPFYKRNLSVAIPVMLSQIGQVVVQMADTMMVGRLGADELASVSYAGAIFNVGLLFCMGTAMGVTPLVGKNISCGRHKVSANLFQNSFLFNMIFGIAVGILLYVLSFFMGNMGQTERVVELAVPYFRIMVASLIPLLIFITFKQFMEGLGDTKKAMIITIGANVLNIGLNYLLIYGKFGFPEMGVQGAAYATLISRMLMPIAFIAVFLNRVSLRRYFLFFCKKNFSKESFKELTKTGLPIGTQIFVEQIAFSFTAIMVGWLGAASLASHQVAMNISFMVFMILSGLSAATTIRVSHQFGRGAMQDMRKAAHASYHLTIFSVSIIAVLIVIFRFQIPYLFTPDPEVGRVSAKLLLIVAIYLIPDSLQVVSLGALRGISDVKKPMIYATFAYLGLNIPIGYLCGFVFGLGAPGIWLGFVCGLGMAAISFIYRFEKKSKIYIEENKSQTIDARSLSA